MNFGGQQQRETKGPSFDIPFRVSLEKLYTGAHFDLLSPSLDIDTIEIEPGVPNGHVITLSGLADTPPQSRGRPRLDPGDLKIHVLQNPHTFFERTNDNLRMTIAVGLKESLIGFIHPIKHLDGSTFLFDRTDQITSHDSIIRVPGKGMPIYNKPGHFGDLFVKVTVIWPESLSSEQRAMLGQILD